MNIQPGAAEPDHPPYQVGILPFVGQVPYEMVVLRFSVQFCVDYRVQAGLFLDQEHNGLDALVVVAQA